MNEKDRRNIPAGEESDRMISLMFKGDPRCKLQIGDRFVKNLTEEDDYHEAGSFGTVKGNIYATNTSSETIADVIKPGDPMDAYLVQYDGETSDKLYFTAGYKIEKI